MKIKGLPIVRSGGPLLRADTENGLGTLSVRFSPFDTWYEINSFWEGRFLERTMPGAFTKTANDAQRADGTFSTKVLFNHGMDMNIGDKLLTVPTRFEEVNADGYHGPLIEGPLHDTSFNRDLLPGLQANGYGSSFMFNVIREDWNNEPGTSDHNPEGIPERTISEVRTFEAGPVTWPASPTASAGMRSRCGTDAWMDHLHARASSRHEDLVRSYEAMRTYYRTAPYKPGIPTPTDETSVRRQIDEAAIAREHALRAYRLDAMKKGYLR
jgi:hypothetical protein